jgi:hypothetical protein
MDAESAAVIAHTRVAGTLGAATLFWPRSGVEVPSQIVGVLDRDRVRTYEVEERLPEEDRKASAEEIKRILHSSWTASSGVESHALHDAIRLRHRALIANDPESRLLLLWSGLERMTSGARGYDKALSAAKDLVAKAVSFGKLRRDIADLCAAIDAAVPAENPSHAALLRIAGGEVDGVAMVERTRLLGLLLGPLERLQPLLDVFTPGHPLLAHRCKELWQAFGEGTDKGRGKKLCEYHRSSERRVSYQVERIYRARNLVAHVGAGPARIRDLAWHAHFYVTQLVAICVHYAEKDPQAVAQEILTERAGRYETFLKLLEVGEPVCMKPQALIRPTKVLGELD